MTEKLFAVSVADALLIDDTSDTLVVKGTALLSSSMEQTMQESEVYGGRGSQLQFTYNYQKVLSFSIEAADFSPAYLALQTGSEIKTELSNYYTDEKVTFNAQGVGTLTKTPIGKVYVEMAANHATTTPVGSTITVPALANKSANVSYQYEATVDVLTIPANSFPKAYKLILTSDIFNTDGDKAYEQQIIAPKYKLDGALSLGLSHDATATFTLNGKTLVDEDGNYAYINYLPMGNTSGVEITSIAANVSDLEIEVGKEQAVTVLGVRGGLYSNVVLKNADLTFASDTPAKATFVNGVIRGVATGTAYLTVSYQGIKDIIKVTVV